MRAKSPATLMGRWYYIVHMLTTYYKHQLGCSNGTFIYVSLYASWRQKIGTYSAEGKLEISSFLPFGLLPSLRPSLSVEPIEVLLTNQQFIVLNLERIDVLDTLIVPTGPGCQPGFWQMCVQRRASSGRILKILRCHKFFILASLVA